MLDKLKSTLKTILHPFYGTSVAPVQSEKKSYNPKNHKSFYVVSAAVLRAMAKSPSKEWSARALADVTKYAESSLRRVCKGLTESGILIRVYDFPATYRIAQPAQAQDLAASYEQMSFCITEGQ